MYGTMKFFCTEVRARAQCPDRPSYGAPGADREGNGLTQGPIRECVAVPESELPIFCST